LSKLIDRPLIRLSHRIYGISRRRLNRCLSLKRISKIICERRCSWRAFFWKSWNYYSTSFQLSLTKVENFVMEDVMGWPERVLARFNPCNALFY